MGSGILRDRGGRSGMIYGHIAASVIAAAHITISSHLFAAFHFGGRHRSSGKASEQRSCRHEHGDEDRSYAAELHLRILLRCANAEKLESQLDASRLSELESELISKLSVTLTQNVQIEAKLREFDSTHRFYRTRALLRPIAQA